MSRGTLVVTDLMSVFAYGAFTLFGRLSQNRSPNKIQYLTQSVPRGARTTVWAPSISLAATLEIDVSFEKEIFLSFPPAT